MKTLMAFVLTVFGSTTALAGVESAYLSGEKVENRDEVVGFGREYALGTARDSANHAANVAGATGIALTSAGVGFILAGNLPVGATLISMGSVEFAQMGANKGVGQQNGDQRTQLVNGSPVSVGNTETSAADKGNSSLDPKLDDYLLGKGIDPTLFKDALFSGQLSDPIEALKALGQNPGDFSTRAIEKAQLEAQKEFAKVSDEVMKNMGGMLGGDPSPKPDGLTKVNPESREPKQEERGVKIAKGSKTSLEQPNAAVSSQFIPNLFGLPANAFSTDDQNLLFEAYLREQGIVPNHPRMNIFQMAQQSYRGFAKSRVAKAN